MWPDIWFDSCSSDSSCNSSIRTRKDDLQSSVSIFHRMFQSSSQSACSSRGRRWGHGDRRAWAEISYQSASSGCPCHGLCPGKVRKNRMDMTSCDRNKYSSLACIGWACFTSLHIFLFKAISLNISYLFYFLMTPVCRLATRCSHSFPALFHFHCHNTISR